MENVTDALKMAFAVFVFVIAIALTLNVFAQIRQTSDVIIRASDKTNYYEYVEETTANGERIVGIETIIPMLYRYTNESVKVILKEKNGTYIQIFDIDIENNVNKYENPALDDPERAEKKKIYASYKDSISLQGGNNELIPWAADTADHQYRRKRVELFLSGEEGFINGTKLKYNKGFWNAYKDKKFIESFQDENTDENEDDELTGGRSNTSQITIVYTVSD